MKLADYLYCLQTVRLVTLKSTRVMFTAELGGCHMKLLAQILIGCYCNASPLYLLVCLALCFSFLFSNSHLQLFQ